MATAGTFCDEVDVANRAGVGMSSDIDSGDTAETDLWIVDYENELCAVLNYDIITNTALLTANGKQLFGIYVSCMAANDAVKYDMSGYTSRTEAEDIINVNRDTALRVLSILRTTKVKSYLKVESGT